MTQTPQTLDELGEGLLLWEQLNTELPTIEAKIPPLFDQFAILDKYEVTVAEDVRTMLVEMPNKFRDFQQTLVDVDIMLKKHKVRLTLLYAHCHVKLGDPGFIGLNSGTVQVVLYCTYCTMLFLFLQKCEYMVVAVPLAAEDTPVC